jgi:hypothetical protein
MQPHARTTAGGGLWVALVALCSLFNVHCATSGSDEPPGTSLGTFHATALLTRNDCGAGVEAPTSYEFDFVLSQDDTAIYWTQSGTTLVGSVDDEDATWVYQASGQADGLCTIQREQVFEATLDDATSPSSLKGTIRQDVAPTTGASCSQQTVAAGGSFDNLPCAIGYVFSATRK